MNIFSNKLANRIILIISIGFFISSFTRVGYCTTAHCADSLAVFISGVFGFFLSWAGLVWLANPLLITSWITTNRNLKLSIITSLLATILSLSFLLFNKIIDNENGDLNEIVSYKLGYWLWAASSLSMLIGNCILYFPARWSKLQA